MLHLAKLLFFPITEAILLLANSAVYTALHWHNGLVINQLPFSNYKTHRIKLVFMIAPIVHTNNYRALLNSQWLTFVLTASQSTAVLCLLDFGMLLEQSIAVFLQAFSIIYLHQITIRYLKWPFKKSSNSHPKIGRCFINSCDIARMLVAIQVFNKERKSLLWSSKYSKTLFLAPGAAAWCKSWGKLYGHCRSIFMQHSGSMKNITLQYPVATKI